DEALEPPLRDARQGAEGDGEKIEGEGQGLAVKIPARNNIAQYGIADHRRRRSDLLFPREDERIVDGGVHLDLEDLATVRQSVSHRAMHLGNAAQGVSILHLTALAVRFADLAALQHATQVPGNVQLPGVRPRLMNALVESHVGAFEGIDDE